MSQANAIPAVKELRTNVTLWKCANCGSFITIEAFEPVHFIVCPACKNAPVDLCAEKKDLLNFPSVDDTCSDYYPDDW